MYEDLLVGLIALGVVPLIFLRIRRGVEEGRLPVYRAYVSLAEQPGRYRVLLAIHLLSLLLVAVIAIDLLLGLDLMGRM